MADATTAVAADVATMKIPVVILHASITALVTMGFSLLAVFLEASRAVVIATMVLAIVGGCGVLASIIINAGRKTARETQALMTAAMDARMTQIETDALNVLGGVAKLTELGLKNGKAVRDLARSLAECQQQVVLEVEKNRVAFYAVAAETTINSSGQRPNLRSVEN